MEREVRDNDAEVAIFFICLISVIWGKSSKRKYIQ